MEFYTMQNTINNSLSKEIAAVMEKCNKIERKLKEQKKMNKSKKESRKQEVIEYEYDEGTEMDEEPIDLPPPPVSYSPFNVRRRIDLRNF